MEYTEEVIKEAESVVDKYAPITNYIGDYDIHCAIQDRQSVLDKVLYLKEYYPRIELHVQIQSLTQQIEYLQSKI